MSNPNSGDELTYEKALAELEQIVRDLEEGRSGLEESLAQYEAGVSLLKRCHQQLQQAEQRIALLTGMNAEGKPITRPFAHAASAEQSAAPAPPATASKPAPPPPPPPPAPARRAAEEEAPPAPPARPAREAPAVDAQPKSKPAGGLLWD
ncbi:MAG: exodeoxyribonuclease VII small subunit [Gemmataceae bacterium]